MAASIVDSRIFGDLFSDAKMRQVWSDENRTAKYLDILAVRIDLVPHGNDGVGRACAKAPADRAAGRAP